MRVREWEKESEGGREREREGGMERERYIQISQIWRAPLFHLSLWWMCLFHVQLAKRWLFNSCPRSSILNPDKLSSFDSFEHIFLFTRTSKLFGRFSVSYLCEFFGELLNVNFWCRLLCSLKRKIEKNVYEFTNLFIVLIIKLRNSYLCR